MASLALLETSLPDAFGGVWLDEGGEVVVGLADGAADGEASAVRSIARDSDAKVVKVARSILELDELANRLLREVTEAGKSDLAPFVAIDPSANRVVLATPTLTTARELVGDTTDVPIDSFRFDLIGGEIAFEQLARRDDTSPWAGGMSFSSPAGSSLTCTMGLPMKKGSGRFMLTAGHCTGLTGSYQDVAYNRAGSTSWNTLAAINDATNFPNTLCWDSPNIYRANPTCGFTGGGRIPTGGGDDLWDFNAGNYSVGDTTGYALWGSNEPRIFYGKSLVGSGSTLHDNTSTTRAISSTAATVQSESVCYSGGRTGRNCGFGVAYTSVYKLTCMLPDYSGCLRWRYVGPLVMTWGDPGSQPMERDSGAPVFKDGSSVIGKGVLEGCWGNQTGCGETNQNYSGGMTYTSSVYAPWIYGAQFVTTANP